jgi:hypothetical protein
MTDAREPREVESPKAGRRSRAPRDKSQRRRWLPRFPSRREPKPPVAPAIILRPYVQPRRRWVGITALLALALVTLPFGYGFSLLAPALMVPFFFPIILLAAICVWALPELDVAPGKLVERFFFMSFLSMPLWPNYLAIDLPGLPWITLIRLTVFPLSFLLLVSISVSKTFRSELSTAVNSVPLVWKGVTAFTCYQIFSIALSNSPMLSLNHLVSDLTAWTGMFFAAAWVFSKPGRLERWVIMLWGIGIILSLIAIREFMLGQVLWAGHIPSFLAVQDDSVMRALGAKMRAGTNRYRTVATFSTPLGLAEYMALCTPFALHFMAGPYKPWVRLAGALSLPVIFNTVVLTDARLGVIGFMLSCLIYTFFWGVLRWRQVKGSLIGPTIVLGYPAIFLAFMAAVVAVPRLRVMTLGGGQQQSSTQARQEQVHRGIPMIIDHPFGHGLARGGAALGFVNGAGVLTVDTYWLLVALDYGIFGFIIFFGTVWAAIGSGARAVVLGPRDREQSLIMPIVIALVVWFVIKAVYSDTENQPTMFIMLAAVSALVHRIKVSHQAPAAPVLASP